MTHTLKIIALLLVPLLGIAQPIYRGQRISLYAFKITEQTDRHIVLRCNAVNTGREPVSFGKNKPPSPILLIELDTLSIPKIIQNRTADISRAFLREKITLTPGQFEQNIALKIFQNPADEPSAELSSTVKIEEKKPVETPVSEEKKTEKKPPSEAVEKPQPVENQKNEEGVCMDLILDTAWVVRQEEKAIVVHFKIKNIGDRSANLFGNTKDTEDNLAINAYFVGGTRLTRGAFLAETIFYKDKSLPTSGRLAPDAIFEGEIDVSTKNRTKFSPNIILEIDPFQTLPDCDKTNNTRPILIK